MNFARIALATAALALSSLAANAVDISGAGATFPYPIYAKWADAYKKETGNGLNYQSIGSGGGIKQIKAKTVTFGASDAPLPGKELDESGLAQFPMVMGAHRAGREPRRRQAGRPDARRPDDRQDLPGRDQEVGRSGDRQAQPQRQAAQARRSSPVHRSDGSGTTYNFTYYLSDVSPDWKTKVGVNTAVQWPVGIGAKGNEGVANNVAQTKGSIGYVEYAYAKQNKLTHTKMVNKAGKTVAPTVGQPSRPPPPTPTGTRSPATA